MMALVSLLFADNQHILMSSFNYKTKRKEIYAY